MKNEINASFATPDGRRLEALLKGPDNGRPIVFLHGVTDSALSYGPLIAELPSHYRCAALTFRGHGGSDKSPGRYDIAAFASDVEAFLDWLGAPQAVIAGHSMGSLVAQRVAIDAPGRVAGLFLIGAFPSLQGNSAIEDLQQEIIDTMTDPVDPLFAQAFQESSVAERPPAAFMDLVVGETLRVPAHVWRAAFAAMMTEDVSRQLSQINAPTGLYWGDRDEIADRRTQQKLLAAIPGATLEIASGLGHSPHWERPDETARALTRFIRRIAG